MTEKLQVFFCSALVAAVIGVVLYFGYKSYYEKRINEVLQGTKANIKIASIAKVLRCYLAAVTIVLFLLSLLYPSVKTTSDCSLISTMTLGSTEKEEVQKKLMELQHPNENFSLNQMKIDEHMTALYAVNDDSYVYALQYRLGRELQKNEVFCVQQGGAVSWVSKDDMVDDVINFIIEGETTGDCQETTLEITIYNFCEGENKYPINLSRTITIAKGGLVS